MFRSHRQYGLVGAVKDLVQDFLQRALESQLARQMLNYDLPNANDADE